MPQPLPSPTPLKWHNTLPQHFSSQPDLHSNTNPIRPTENHHAATPEAGVFRAAGEVKVENESIQEMEPSSTGSTSSTSRRCKSARPASTATTPVKLTTSGVVPPSAGSLQTPPPTATKKRGRPSKASYRQPGNPVKSRNIQSQHRPQIALQHDDQVPQAAKTAKVPKRTEGRVRSTLTTPKQIFPAASTSLISEDFPNTDLSLGWSLCGEGDYSGDLGVDLFMRSDIGFENHFGPMTLPFDISETDYDNESSINPSLIFSSRPTSDVSSIFGSCADEMDMLSSSSQSNEQPYQHQLEYSRREQATGPRRTLKRKIKSESKVVLTNDRKNSLLDIDNKLRRTISENVLADITRERNFMVSGGSESRVCTSRTKSRGSYRQTPPPRARNTVRLLISPSGHAKTETKVVYEDSETELDELNYNPSIEDTGGSRISLDGHLGARLGLADECGSVAKKLERPRMKFDHHPSSELGFFGATSLSASTPAQMLVRPSIPGNYATKRDTIPHIIEYTPKKQASRFKDECILSSPKLPTPLKSAPENYSAISSSMNASFDGLEMDSRLTSRPPFFLGDESEVETVVDEAEIVSNNEANSKENELEKDDAIFALRSVVAKRRGLPSDRLASTSPDKLIPFKRKRIKVNDNRNLKNQPQRRQQSSMLAVPNSSDIITDRPIEGAQPSRSSKVVGHGLDSTKDLKTISCANITSPDNVESLPEGVVIRCVCGLDDDDGATMVQCDLCKNWLHIGCTGLDLNQLPKQFGCSFCGSQNIQFSIQ